MKKNDVQLKNVKNQVQFNRGQTRQIHVLLMPNILFDGMGNNSQGHTSTMTAAPKFCPKNVMQFVPVNTMEPVSTGQHKITQNR